MRENKERIGKTIRFSIRIPREAHRWLKERSESSRGKDYVSMNEMITALIEEAMK